MNPSQNKKLHALLTQTGMTEEKTNLVKSYSGNRATSSKDLTSLEAMHLIRHLEQMVSNAKPVQEKAPSTSSKRMSRELWLEGAQMRNTVKYYCRQLNWDRGKTDQEFWDCIDAFCLKHCAIKKTLNEYLPSELVDVVTEIKAMYNRDTKPKVNEQTSPK